MNALHCAAFVTVLLSALTSSRAQDAPAPAAPMPPTTMTGTGQGAQDPLEAAEASLRENQFVEGYNKNAKRFVAIGVGSLIEVKKASSRMDSLADLRLAAFQNAMNSAKQRLAEFIAAEITSSVKSVYEEPDVAAQGLADIPGAAMVKEIVDSAVPDVAKRPAVLTSDQFKSAVKVVAVQEVGALQAFQAFEHVEPDGVAGKIVVIAMLSPNSKRMQEAMLGKGGAVKADPQGPVSEWIGKLDSEGRLMFTQGVVQRINENGEVTLVAFSQASPRTESGRATDAARGKAIAQAQQMLRQFAGELVASDVSRTVGYSLKDFADKSQDFLDEGAFRSTVESVASSLTLPGATPVKTKAEKYPANGATIVTVAVEWNLSSALAANELGAALNKLSGSRGGTGTGGILPPKPEAPTPPKKPATGGGGTGSKPETPTPPKKPARGGGGGGSGG